MKILIVAVHFQVTGARYITGAFARLGHDVRHIGAMADLEDVWGVAIYPNVPWFPSELPDDWTPDLIILADTLVKDWQPPAQWANIPLIYWTQDNHVRNVRRAGVRHYFLAHFHGAAHPVKEQDETWLPCGFDPVRFSPSHIPWDKRTYDVCLVGVMYPHRVKIIDKLRAAGFRVYAETGDVYSEFQAAYANSRISLCVSANGDVAQRIFETAAIGCHILTDPLLDLSDETTNAKLGLAGFSVYHSPDDCVEAVQRLLTVDRQECIAATEYMQKVVWENHTWDKRAQVVIDWFEREYRSQPTPVIINGEALTEVKQLPYLNLGCGTTHLPSPPPPGHELVDTSIYQYPLWTNVDKVKGVGADRVFDLFKYPWPLEDSSYGGALLAHIAEHIPHGIEISNGDSPDSYLKTKQRVKELEVLQDGWYAFFAELYRVLAPGAIVHIISPYGHSDGAIVDPSHTRYLTPQSFMHSMTPSIDDGPTFRYENGGINFQIVSNPVYRFNEYMQLAEDVLLGSAQEYRESSLAKFLQLAEPKALAIGLFNNVCYDFYVQLRCVK